MGWLLVELLRRLLLWLKADKYVDGLTEAAITITPASDGGWAPQEIEVAGQLRLRPGLLRPHASVACPAAVELSEGGRATRVVLRLPQWLRLALVDCFWKSSRSSSSPSDIEKDLSQDTEFPWVARTTQRWTTTFAREILKPVVPPLPLHLPPSMSPAAPSSCTNSPQLEPVVVEVHGLAVNLRTYLSAELADFRRAALNEAVERLLDEGKRSCAPCGSAAAGQRPEAPISNEAMQPLSSGWPLDVVALSALAERVYEHLRVECRDAKVSVTTGAGDWARLSARELDMVACWRPTRDRAAETWFGGARLPPSAGRQTVELCCSDITLSCGATAAVETANGAGSCAELTVAALQVVKVGPRHEGQPPQGAPSAAVPEFAPVLDGDGVGAWRFLAPLGAHLSLPDGCSSLEPVFSIVNAVNASVAACDPCSIVSKDPVSTDQQVAGDLCRQQAELSRLWWQEYRPENHGSAVGSTNCVRCTREVASCSSGQPRGLSPCSMRLRELQDQLPALMQVAALLSGSSGLSNWTYSEAVGKKLQRALCYAFASFWPCSPMECAVELGALAVNMGDAQCARRATGLGMGGTQAFEADLPPLASLGPVVCIGAIGLYVNQWSRPYDWRKAVRLFTEGAVVTSRAYGQELLSCRKHGPGGGGCDESAFATRLRGGSGQGAEVGLFQMLVESPPIAVELASGCFAPTGLAGAPPSWSVAPGSDAAVAGPEGTWRGTAELEKRDGRGHQELDEEYQLPLPPSSVKLVHEVPSDEFLMGLLPGRRASEDRGGGVGALAEWWDLADQPPRSTFIRVTLNVPLHLGLRPCMLEHVTTPKLHLECLFADANFPVASTLHVQVSLSSVKVHVQDTDGTCLSMTAELPRGATLGFKHDTAGAVELRLSLRGMSACCSTGSQEVRPACKAARSVTLLLRRCLRGLVAETSFELSQPSSSKNRVIISPQLCLVLSHLAEQMREAHKALVRLGCGRKEGESTCADEATGLEGCLQRRVTGSIAMGTMVVDLCDAVSALTRVHLGLRVNGSATIVSGQLSDLAARAAAEVTGEVASQRAGLWEPFLEPWALGAEVAYDVASGLKFDLSDFQLASDLLRPRRDPAQLDGLFQSHSWREHLWTHASPLLLNVTPQLVRVTLCLSKQLQQHLAAPADGSREPASPRRANASSGSQGASVGAAAAGQARIAALNLSGCSVSAWFYGGSSAAAARRRASGQHWPAAPRATAPAPSLELEGRAAAGGPRGPTALDRFITVPASTAVALQMGGRSGEHPSGQRARWGARAPPAQRRRGEADLGAEEAEETEDEDADKKVCTRDVAVRNQQSMVTESDKDQRQDQREGGHIIGGCAAKVEWPRREDLPILPLRAGWCVGIRPEGRGPGGRRSEFCGAAWQRTEFLVQVLEPRPATCLVLIASPLRIFNYTDRHLDLSFQTGYDTKIAFDADVCAAATIPTAWLGAAQPFDAQPLMLPPSAVGSNDGPPKRPGGNGAPTGDASTGVWPLPRNSVCCVPVGEELLGEEASETLCFRLSCCGDACSEESWSQWVYTSKMPEQEWFFCSCKCGDTTLHFRIAMRRQVSEEPYKSEVINFMILPAFSVANVTPSTLSVEVLEDAASFKRTSRRGLCGRRRVTGHTPSWRWRDTRAPPEEVLPGGDTTPLVEPWAAIHLYSVNSSHSIRLRLCFPAAASQWSAVIRDVCFSCASKAARVEVPFEARLPPPTLEIICVDFVAAVSCPFWLINQTSLTLHAGRRGERFPVVRGITMLDGSLPDVKLYWDCKELLGLPNDARQGSKTFSSGNSPSPVPSVEGNEVHPLEEQDLEEPDIPEEGVVSFTFSSIARLAEWAAQAPLLRSALPVPVTSGAVQGRVRTDRGAFAFTVIREALPSPFGELAAPTTCFRVVPSVMVSNRTTAAIWVRSAGIRDSNLLHIAAGKSAPCWALANVKDQRRIQFQAVAEDLVPHDGAWSGDIPCEPMGSCRVALALQSTRGSGVQFFAVEVSDAVEGIVSVTVSRKACLVVGCLARAVAVISVQTDCPPAGDAKPVEGRTHTAQRRNLVRKGSSGSVHARDAGAGGAQMGASALRDASAGLVHRVGKRLHTMADSEAGARVLDAGTGLVRGVQVVLSPVVRDAGAGVAAVREVGAELASKVLKAVPHRKCLHNPAESIAEEGAQLCPKEQPCGFMPHSPGSPFRVGWYQPFSSMDTVNELPSLTLHLQWETETQERYANKSVPITINLGRATPMVVLRPINPLAMDGAGLLCPIGVMVCIRPQAQREMKLHAERIRRERGSDCAAECADLWAELGSDAPELLEVADARLEQLAGAAVEWVCGECGRPCSAGRPETPPQRCAWCGTILMGPDGKDAASDSASVARSASPKRKRSGAVDVTLQLSSLSVSIVSQKLRQELFVARLDGMRFTLSRWRGKEEGRFIMAGCRVDCQVRISERCHALKSRLLPRLKRAFLNTHMSRLVFQSPERLAQCLLDTPAVLAAVERRRPVGVAATGTAAAATGVEAGSEVARTPQSSSANSVAGLSDSLSSSDTVGPCPCLDADWKRPFLDNGSTALNVGTLRVSMQQRWELMVDGIAYEALLRWYAEIASILSSAPERDQVPRARSKFEETLGDAKADAFMVNFTPPEMTRTISAEQVHISAVEVATWVAIELARVPTSLMPASLMFLLKILSGSFSELLCVDGSTMIFKEWTVPGGPIGQVLTILRTKYEVSMLMFLARAFGCSNLLTLPRLLIPNLLLRQVTNICAELVDVIDFSVFTLDEKYVQERTERNEEQPVDSLQEGLEVAGDRLLAGFVGIFDVVEQPRQQWRARGVRGVPTGLCRGFLSCFFKPLDGLFQALRALIQGISAACVGRCLRRRRRRPQRRHNAHGGRAGHQHGGRGPLARARGTSVSQPPPRKSGVAALTATPAPTPMHTRGHAGPALHGSVGLRLPRMLFGEPPAIKPFTPWHAELLKVLGPVLSKDICDAWRVAGDEHDTEHGHIVLCALHKQLMLVDLNRQRQKEAPAFSRRSSRTRRHVRDSVQYSNAARLPRLCRALQRACGCLRRDTDSRRRRRGSAVTITTPLHSLRGSQLDLVAGRALRSEMLTALVQRRSSLLPAYWRMLGRRRREADASLHVGEVIRSWSWVELRDVAYESSETENALHIKVSEGNEGHAITILQYRLSGKAAPLEDVRRACQEIKQAIMESQDNCETPGN